MFMVKFLFDESIDTLEIVKSICEYGKQELKRKQKPNHQRKEWKINKANNTYISISIDKLCINTEDASREWKRELKTRRRMGSEKG